MDAHVLVPLKVLDPKSRLAHVLPAAERTELMRRLLDRVVGAVREAGVEQVTVVTREPIDGFHIWEDHGLPWNDALAAAIDETVTAPLAAIISADLPLLHAEEVTELLVTTPERGIAIARALDGGTNAVAMRPPGLVRTRFGEPGSCAVHAGLGVPYVVVDLPGLAFDVDTPDDLARMQTACL
ncbi:MAG: 2-phospho-L-lactate guanylyltransferase [Verrucomicrobiota bacterium]